MGNLVLRRREGESLVFVDAQSKQEIGRVRISAVEPAASEYGLARVKVSCQFGNDVTILRDELVAGHDPQTGRVVQYAPAAYPGDGDEGGWQ